MAIIQEKVTDGVCYLTLNRPDKHNAMSLELLDELEERLWSADLNQRIHCIVIRGAGKNFCAGYDLSAGGGYQGQNEIPNRRSINDTIDDDIWTIERNARAIRTLSEIHKPVIAQVQGACLAGGTDLALACDMVVAASDARFGFPAVRNLGAPPNNMWIYHCGPQWAKRLLLTGDIIEGTEAAEIGLVLKAVEPVDLDAEVDGIANRLAKIDPDLLAANKRSVNLALELMGSQTMQRLAGEIDARAHLARAAQNFGPEVAEKGLRQALRDRDAPFGDGLVRVRGHEKRDDSGKLVD